MKLIVLDAAQAELEEAATIILNMPHLVLQQLSRESMNKASFGSWNFRWLAPPDLANSAPCLCGIFRTRSFTGSLLTPSS
nr:hypothetical protein [Propionivibrio sp.]